MWKPFALLLMAFLTGQQAWASKQGSAVSPPESRPTKEQPQQPQPPAGLQGRAPSSCPQPLRQGCEGQQAACRMACPPMWSMNPGAPAFTPTDRAGCTQQCLSRYLSCLRLYGC
jgi:hypothetical protein